MYQVTSSHHAEQSTLVMTAKLAVSEIPGFLGKAYAAVAELIGRSGLDFAGPPFARHRPLDTEFSEFEVEAGFPVDRPAEGAGDVIASSLPESEVAVVTYLGPYDGMRPAYDAIEAWIFDRGGQPEGPAWEIYYTDPNEEPDPGKWRTEIVQPYRVL